MADPPRIYTYKVTFEEVPHWYWGVHKEKKHGEGYLGSPQTNNWFWEFYTPCIQILEVFPFTEQGWRQAQEVEDRLIKPDLNNPLCLNEAFGAIKSLKVCKKAGQIGGRTTRERGTGIFAASPQEKSEWCKRSGKIGGATTASKGAFDLTSPTCIKTPESLRKGALSQHSLRVRCKVTGYVSTPCGLSHWQKARGIDHLNPNNRETVNVENEIIPDGKQAD